MKNAHVEDDGTGLLKLVNSATGVAEMTAFDCAAQAARWGVHHGFEVEDFEHLILFQVPGGGNKLIDLNYVEILCDGRQACNRATADKPEDAPLYSRERGRAA